MEITKTVVYNVRIKSEVLDHDLAKSFPLMTKLSTTIKMDAFWPFHSSSGALKSFFFLGGVLPF